MVGDEEGVEDDEEEAEVNEEMVVSNQGLFRHICPDRFPHPSPRSRLS